MTQPSLNSLWGDRVLILSGMGCLLSFSAWGRAVQAQAPIDTMPTTSIAPSASAPSQVPKAAIEPVPAVKPPEPILAPTVGESGAYIDRTDYSLGATRRYEPPAVANVAKPSFVGAPSRSVVANEPVAVAPVASSREWSVTRPTWTAPSAPSVIGQAYATVQNYYNRTIRPIGRIGNGDIKLIFPLAIPAPITSLFGWRVHPITGDTRIHTGTDLGAPIGTPVLAALTGRVIMADFFGGYGLAVALEHSQGSQQTLYAHLSELFVKPGEIVKQGSVIGRVGSTGNSTGPHLHFEFRQQTQDGTWVAQDAGVVLETAVADLAKSLQVAQTSGQVKPQ